MFSQTSQFDDVNAARDVCRQKGADLATIINSTEETIIAGIIKGLVRYQSWLTIKFIYICARTYLHIHTHTHTPEYIYIYIYIYIYTHKHTPEYPPPHKRTQTETDLKGVSSFTSLHYLWRSLGTFSLACAQK